MEKWKTFLLQLYKKSFLLSIQEWWKSLQFELDFQNIFNVTVLMTMYFVSPLYYE